MTDKITFGEKLAGRFAKIFASWPFGILSLLIFNAWALLNSFHVIKLDPDLAFGNFSLSELTYFVDLVLMMNSVRQAISDREKLNAILRLEKSHTKENALLRAEISHLSAKIDSLRNDLSSAM